MIGDCGRSAPTRVKNNCHCHYTKTKISKNFSSRQLQEVIVVYWGLLLVSLTPVSRDKLEYCYFKCQLKNKLEQSPRKMLHRLLPAVDFWCLLRCKNVRPCEQYSCKKNPILGKIFAIFYAVLSRKWVMLRFRTFWWHFLAYFGTLCNFLCFFLRYLSPLGLLRCFVANSICRNLRTFSGKIILVQTVFV